GLSRKTWARTLQVHDQGIAKGTHKTYNSARAHFRQWCSAERIKLASNAPVPEQILCAYAAAMAGVCAGGTARSRLAAIHFWHDRHALAWKGSPRLLRILKVITNAAPAASRRKERPPVTEAMLDEALKALDPDRPFDVCVAAAMLTTFWCQLRLGEVISTTRQYDFDALPTVKGLRLRAEAGGSLDRVTSALWLPRTKVERQGVWVWIARHYNDPSFALQDHIRVNSLSPDDPLFAYRHDESHELIALTKSAFLGCLNEIWAESGMQRITGHSFRIGGTTALLRAGVDPDVVKMAGRWKSDSFLQYWRALDHIISSHM
ncbi:DNA breaking-rejoining enzyme, partial [Exidia glandulosa HHB12029]